MTGIMLYSGYVKIAREIEVGDLLMGDDGTPRQVLKLHHGKAKLFIIQSSESFDIMIVTGNHTLCLKTDEDEENIVEMSVYEFLSLSYLERKKYFMIRNAVTQWEKYEAPEISGIKIGKWLAGDKSLDEDEDVFMYKTSDKGDCDIFYLKDEIMFSSQEYRREIIEGFTSEAICRDNLFKTENECCAHNIWFFARSLGFHSEIIDKIFVEIDFSKTSTRFENLTICPLGVDNFYGFETDGNRRFLLDNVIVSHNCQLPCVKNEKFCFESKSWDKCVEETIYFTDIMRQKDKEFQDCLNEVRIGVLSEKTVALLESRLNLNLDNIYKIKPTRLFTKKMSVNNLNQLEVRLL